MARKKEEWLKEIAFLLYYEKSFFPSKIDNIASKRFIFLLFAVFIILIASQYTFAPFSFLKLPVIFVYYIVSVIFLLKNKGMLYDKLSKVKFVSILSFDDTKKD